MITFNERKFSPYKISTKVVFMLVFCMLTVHPILTQNEQKESILTLFEDYTTQYREVAYCHLNKSTYIKGEMVGFSSYVFDKDLKVPSKMTSNLYCVITDNNNKIIKSKLLKVTNGFSNNVFKIDSSFTSGNYTLKAYTNWMNNFDEPNAFVESFRVIDPEVETTIKKTVIKPILDAQFLPEGGYFVDGVKTNVGVIIKNSKGYGISNSEGTVYDSDNKSVATFKTNFMGIGKFILYPDINQDYVVKIKYLNNSFDFKIDTIRPIGIAVHILRLPNQIGVEFKTNQNTLNIIKGKPYTLSVHNGTDAKVFDLTFNKKELTLVVDQKELFSGINIFTLFNENNKPVLERMVFNYDGINILNLGTAEIAKFGDSTQIRIPFPKLVNASEQNWNISISALPEETKSYQRHQNIISHTYLQPYVRGYIENAQYYFTAIDAKKKYELDNLLITQGWSSYDWGNIFNSNVADNFVFEDGIVLKANQNNKKQKDFILYPLEQTNGQNINLAEDEDSFVVSKLYPIGIEKLALGTINRKGKVINPKLYLQFFPSKIPDYNNQFEILHSSLTIAEDLPKSKFTFSEIKGTQELDEVIVKAKAKALRIEKLENDPFLRLYNFDDAKRRMNLTLAQYINGFVLKYVAQESGGKFLIARRMGQSSSGDSPPVIYLDDMLITNLDLFYGYYLNTVEYITVNESGLGEGFLGSGGVIKIYTSLEFVKKQQKNPFVQFQFPLTFSENKKFYVPKYSVYNNDFFRAFGVIDWIPDCKIDNNDNLSFKVYNPSNNDIKLFIEGVTEQGDFVSETKVITKSENN